MTLDIIVPHYDEPFSEGRKLFDMLALQRDIDFSQFRVICINDGEENDIYPQIVRRDYPYEVICITIPHKGVSAARNRGLKFSTAKWVMFCDFDDTFTSIYSLRSIFDTLDTEDFDMLWYPFYIETCKEQKRQTREDFNLTFIHGKVYRRSFLIEHDIWFEESLYFSEDTAFNNVVHMEMDHSRIGHIRTEIIPYVWSFRPLSCTTSPEKMYRNSVCLFRRQLYVADQFLKRGKQEEHDALCIRAMCDAYVALNRTDIDEDRSEFADEVWRFYKDHQSISVSMEVIEIALNGAMKEMSAPQEALPEDKPFLKWLSEFASEKKGVANVGKV